MDVFSEIKLFRFKIIQIAPVIVILVVTLISGANLLEYISFSFELLIVLVLSPFVIYIRQKEADSFRFAFLSLFFLILYPVLKIQSTYFFGFLFLILFIIESNYGKLNNLPIFIVFLLSPMASYIIKVLGFPVRLELTNLAANTLSLIYSQTESLGNIILINNQQFSVDSACVGLNMIKTGLVVQLFLVAWYSKKKQVEIPFYNVILLIISALTLLIICNFFRIILLVILKFPPDTFGHELIGIACFIIYFLLPSYFITSVFAGNSKKQMLKRGKKYTYLLKYSFTFILIIFIVFLNIKRAKFKNINTDPEVFNCEINGFKKEVVKSEILKFTNENAIVYIKPCCNIYGADHNPLVCWEGSGYKFDNIFTTQLKNREVYYTILKRKDEKNLYTAWWFDNGSDKTISQLDWRWKMIKGAEPYRLINVTTSNIRDLRFYSENLIIPLHDSK